MSKSSRLSIGALALLVLAATPDPLAAQRSGVSSVLRALDAGNVDSVVAALAAAPPMVGDSLIGTAGVTVLGYALLFDDVSFFRRVVAHASDPYQPVRQAAEYGASAHVLDALAMGRFQALEQIASAGRALARPLSDASRAALRDSLRLGRPVDVDALERRPPDETAVRVWVQRLLAAGATPAQMDGISYVSRIPSMMEEYFYATDAPLGMWYHEEHLFEAVAAGEWRLADHLLRRGASIEALAGPVDPSTFADPERALGYVVRAQVVDLDRANPALARYRSGWAPPTLRIRATPYWTGTGLHTDPWISAPLVPFGDRWGRYIAGVCVDGRGYMAHVLGPRQETFIYVDGIEGLKRYQREPCNHQYLIRIPGTSAAARTTHHSVTIRREGPDDADSVIIRRGNDRIAALGGGHQWVTVSRALGDVDIYVQPMRPNGSAPAPLDRIAISVEHPDAPLLTDVGPSARLRYFTELLRHRASQDLTRHGMPYVVDDARTSARLLSERLVEAQLPSVLAGQIIATITSIAETSQLQAAFTSYLIGQNRLSGADLPDLLENVEAIPDSTIRAELRAFRDATDKQSVLLRLLHLDFVSNYERQARRLEDLIFELGQYHDRDGLERTLGALMASVPSVAGDRARRNLRLSAELFSRRPSDGTPKGDVIRRFLNPTP